MLLEGLGKIRTSPIGKQSKWLHINRTSGRPRNNGGSPHDCNSTNNINSTTNEGGEWRARSGCRSPRSPKPSYLGKLGGRI